MKTIIRRKIKKNKLFEDDAQQQPAQNGQQSAQQGQQSAQNGQHPAQSGDPNAQGAGTNMNLCLQNVQKFITGLYQQIQQQINKNKRQAYVKKQWQPHRQSLPNIFTNSSPFTSAIVLYYYAWLLYFLYYNLSDLFYQQ